MIFIGSQESLNNQQERERERWGLFPEPYFFISWVVWFVWCVQFLFLFFSPSLPFVKTKYSEVWATVVKMFCLWYGLRKALTFLVKIIGQVEGGVLLVHWQIRWSCTTGPVGILSPAVNRCMRSQSNLLLVMNRCRLSKDNFFFGTGYYRQLRIINTVSLAIVMDWTGATIAILIGTHSRDRLIALLVHWTGASLTIIIGTVNRCKLNHYYWYSEQVQA